MFVLRKVDITDTHNLPSVLIRKITESGAVSDIGLYSHSEIWKRRISPTFSCKVIERHPIYLLNAPKLALPLAQLSSSIMGSRQGMTSFSLRRSESLPHMSLMFALLDVDRYGVISPSGFVDYRPDEMKAHRSTARPGERSRFARRRL